MQRCGSASSVADLDPTLYFDANPNTDPDPDPDPTPNFPHIGKSELLFTTVAAF
jgi:hypothetical protein